MSSSLNRLIDRLEHGGKAAAKVAYRRPLIEAARVWRRMLRGSRFIGVTGSAGKTTTKELLHLALETRYRCAKSTDSDNQLYSIARTLVGVRPWTQLCVQEIGASTPGALDPMLALLMPHVGVVTNVGLDHFKAFRTPVAVAAEKAKLVASLPAHGLAVLNADDEHVAAMASACRARVVTYGLHSGADFRAELVADRWPDRLAMRIRHQGESVLAETRLLGGHQAHNVLAAIATASSLGISLEEAAGAMSRYEPLLGRMSVYASARGVTFIRDDWKAPNWSLPRAFEYVAGARAARKLIVMGSISDYGGTTHRVYRRAVTGAMQAADHVLIVGPHATSTARRLGAAGAEKLTAFETVRDAAGWLSEFARAGDLVLLKGSNNEHLARFALVMDRHVGCWRRRCGRDIFCDVCRLIGEPAPP